MNARASWLAANDEFLAASLDALRERLERMARQAGAQPPDQSGPLAAEPHWLPDSPIERRCGDRAGRTRQTPPEAMQSGHAPALVLLAARFCLTDFERDILLLCAAMELDTRMPALCSRAQVMVGGSYPTFALAMALFDAPEWDALSPERPLRFWHLIDINQPGAQPLATSALRIDERILNYLKGLNYLDDRVVPFATPVHPGTEPLPPSQSRLVDEMATRVADANGAWSLPLFQLAGADGAIKLVLAGQTASRLGVNLFRLCADQIPAQVGDQDILLRLWQRECALQPLALYVDASELERTGNPQAAALRRWFSRGIGVAFLDTREPWPDPGCASTTYDVVKPTHDEQRAAWLQALGEGGAPLAARLAAQFNLNTATIHGVAASAAAQRADPDGVLWRECLRQSRPALNQLAQPLQPKARWDDIALPAPEKRLLRQIAGQVAHRMTVYDDWGFRGRMSGGLGISVLFAGESGTGKTMAAEVIANELDLLLYRIDLSAVVSKYIGETEKNLRRLFDVAEDGGAILFFDEADALFGKRSEVKDSHDRYANIEINYLLQRMEAYRGLAILATNMKSALDSAFVRRLRFMVNFPFPAVAERIAIWQRVFPPQAPVGELDYARLGRLNITGGNISNIAINAAFLAAQSVSDSRITMPLLLEAARNEFRKMERPINEADFGWLETTEGKT